MDNLMNKLVSFLSTGSIAALATAVCLQFGLPLWLLFLAWVSYFLLGARPALVPGFVAAFSVGLALGWVIVGLGTAWQPGLGACAFPLAVACVAGGVMLTEGLPRVDAIPAYYLGIVAYFALGGRLQATQLAGALTAAILGLLAGWASVAIRLALARRFEPKRASKAA
jgi:hypothetical protein